MSDPAASEPPQGLSGDGAAAELAPSQPFPIVGIGASAGGLEALTELLQATSPRPGLAFVVALHLDPHQKSLLPELVAKTTPMTVREVAEGMPVEVNHVYLIPPAADMALRDGRLFLTPRGHAGRPDAH